MCQKCIVLQKIKTFKNFKKVTMLLCQCQRQSIVSVNIKIETKVDFYLYFKPGGDIYPVSHLIDPANFHHMTIYIGLG